MTDGLPVARALDTSLGYAPGKIVLPWCGACGDDVGANVNQGSVYFDKLVNLKFANYLPLVVKNAP